MILDDKRVLITGGTGSFGNAFITRALTSDVRKLIVFSRDELKQYEMAARYKDAVDAGRLAFFLGDVRDQDRLRRAFELVDIVIHAAALKQVPACEYNPLEAKKTNVDGAHNVIEAAIDCMVGHVVALSTDKATNPVNTYGTTKALAEKLFTASNVYSPSSTKFACVRYGNVAGSRGSIIPSWKRAIARGDSTLPITHDKMTRFWFDLNGAVDLVLYALETMRGGETYVPELPSFRVTDLAAAMAPHLGLTEVGIRPGEKLHEAMISADESHEFVWDYDQACYIRNGIGKHLVSGWEYSSGTNHHFLTVPEIREALEHAS